MLSVVRLEGLICIVSAAAAGVRVDRQWHVFRRCFPPFNIIMNFKLFMSLVCPLSPLALLDVAVQMMCLSRESRISVLNLAAR